MHRSPIGTLFPLDLEIKATLRRNRAERRRKLLQDRTVASILEEETHFSDSLSPDSPSSRESANQHEHAYDDYYIVIEKKKISKFIIIIIIAKIKSQNKIRVHVTKSVIMVSVMV